METEESKIRKFPIRFKVSGESEGETIDDMIVDHLDSLKTFGGQAEWLRAGIREHYKRERLAVMGEEGKLND